MHYSDFCVFDFFEHMVMFVDIQISSTDGVGGKGYLVRLGKITSCTLSFTHLLENNFALH